VKGASRSISTTERDDLTALVRHTLGVAAPGRLRRAAQRLGQGSKIFTSPLTQGLAALIALGLGFLVFLVGDGILKSAPDSSREPKPALTVQVQTPKPTVASWRNYVADDGRIPEQSGPNQLLGFYESVPREKLIESFGQPDYQDENFMQWYSDSHGISGLTISADFSSREMVSGISLAIAPLEVSPDLRIALPEALTLGSSTIQDAIDAIGEPTYTRWSGAENQYDYELYFDDGSESSRCIKIMYSTTVDSPEDPGGFNDELRRTRFTYFGFEDGPPSGDADDPHPLESGWVEATQAP
jgi:hypothetical protein